MDRVVNEQVSYLNPNKFYLGIVFISCFVFYCKFVLGEGPYKQDPVKCS